MCELSGRVCQSCSRIWPINEPEIICNDARKNGALCQPSLTLIMRRETEPLCLDCAVQRAEARERRVNRTAWAHVQVTKQHIEHWRQLCPAEAEEEPGPGLGLGPGSEVKQEADGVRGKLHGLGISNEVSKEGEDEEDSKKPKAEEGA